MPLVRSTNVSITPPNTRTVDVAQRAVRTVAQVQQRKYAGAFRVAGNSVLIYNLLESGILCSCSAHGKALATRLNRDGKLTDADINSILTGGMEFRVNDYKVRPKNTQNWIDNQGLPASNHPENEFDPWQCGPAARYLK